jgi:pimeloyl-ACP methyl ester carboxylesterase
MSAVSRSPDRYLRCKPYFFIFISMKSKFFFFLFAGLSFLSVCFIDKAGIHAEAKIYPVGFDTLTMHDSARNRLIPLALYYPKTEKPIAKQKLIILSHGYSGNKGGDNIAYTYLTNFFAGKGFYVVSIQHELPTDELMNLGGKPQEVRRPNWDKGVKNIVFTISRLKKIKPQLDYKHVVLIGHSNGGDICMLLANQYPKLADKVISLDNRRMAFPRTGKPKIYSLRSSDQVADEGVLPTAEEQKKFGIKIIKLANTIHNDMDDHANAEQRKEITTLLSKFIGD